MLLLAVGEQALKARAFVLDVFHFLVRWNPGAFSRVPFLTVFHPSEPQLCHIKNGDDDAHLQL